MDQTLELLLSHLDDTRGALWRAVDEVPDSLTGRRPIPDGWSVAEVLEHLGLLESRVGVLLEKHIAGMTPRTGPAPRFENVDAIFETARVVDRSRRITTGDATRPMGKLDVERARKVLEASRRKFRDVVQAANGLPLESVTVPHVAFGPINLYQWIAFVGSHEARHAAQIREVSENLRSAPPPGSALDTAGRSDQA